MAICRMCHRSIPDGRDFCEECEQKRTNQADESYLDSLLSLVSENDTSSGVSRMAATAETREDRTPADQDIIGFDEQSDEDQLQTEEIEDILNIMDNDMTDGLPDLINSEEIIDEADVQVSEPEVSEAEEADNVEAETEDTEAEDTEADPVASEQEDDDASELLAQSYLDGLDISEAEASSDEGLEDITQGLEDITDMSADIGDITDMPDGIGDITDLSDTTADSSDDTAEGSEGSVDDLIDLLSDNTISPFEASGIDIGGESSDDLISPFEDMNISTDGTEDLLNDITASTDIDSIMDNIESGELEGEINKLMPSDNAPAEKPAKKKSLFMKLFGNVVVERTPEELEEYKKKLEEDEQKKKEEAELKKQRKAQTKEERAAEKEQKKAEKAEADKAKAEAKRKAKEEAKEKARKKKEERLALEAEEVDEGRINRIGASILFVIFAAITVLIIFGSSIYSYNLSIKNAQREFDVRHYNEAYYEVYGIDIKDDDIALYDKIMTVMYVNTQLNAYEYYMTSNNREKALDSLLKGLARYDKYLALAIKLDIADDLMYVRNSILEELQSTFGMSESEAYSTMSITDTIDYSDYLYELLGTYEVEGLE